MHSRGLKTEVAQDWSGGCGDSSAGKRKRGRREDYREQELSDKRADPIISSNSLIDHQYNSEFTFSCTSFRES